MSRERDAFSWQCARCGRENETPCHQAGSRLTCGCGASFDFIAMADLGDLPDDLRAQRAWSEMERAS